MSMTDPIADMLVRIKNAAAVGKPTVKMPSSKIKVAIAKVLKDEGYIADSRVTKDGAKSELEIVAEVFRRPSGHRAPAALLALGPSPVPWQGRAAQGPRWPRRRDHLHLEGHHDRLRRRASRASAAKSCASWLRE
jgi:hypothetical protein